MTTIHILVVDDNPADVELTKIAFENSTFDNRISVAEDGEEALDYLYKRGKFSDVTPPDIILLDLNLPRKSGKEVLAVIKQDSDLCGIPVIMMTSSQAECDVIESYRLHVNCYIIKPVTLDKFMVVTKTIEDFWINTVKLPKHTG